jgi:hypothetical protein
MSSSNLEKGIAKSDESLAKSWDSYSLFDKVVKIYFQTHFIPLVIIPHHNTKELES